MSDNPISGLHERMRQVAADARGERPADPPHDPETGEIPRDTDEGVRDIVQERPPMQPGHAEVQPAPTATPGVGASFTPTPAEERPEPIFTPEPEPIHVQAAPPPEEPAEQPQPEPEVINEDRRNEPWAARTMGDFIDLLERGQFGMESLQALQALALGMSELAERTGKKKKGKIVLTINLETEGEAFMVEGAFKVTAPPQPRARNLLWQDQADGAFLPTMPKQKVFFGREVAEHGPREMRQIGSNRDIRTL